MESSDIQDVVKARKFVLVDDYGTERATIDADAGDGCSIELSDWHGKMRARLAIASHAVALELYTDDGKERAHFGLLMDGHPFIELYNAEGETVWKAPPPLP